MTPDVWLRSDYQHNIALGEVHLVRASAVQHDDDFVPLYDSETVEGLRAERDALEEQLMGAKRSIKHYFARWQEVLTERDALRAFAQAVMESWPEGDVDGGDLQDAAEKHGLLNYETWYEPCGTDCSCIGIYGEAGDAEWGGGVACYRKTPLLTGEQP